MKLSELCRHIPDCEQLGDDVEITDIAHDSRKVEPGGLYIALVGEHSDGHDFIAEATARGAVAIAVHRDQSGWYAARGLPVLVTKDTRAVLPVLAAAFFEEPSRRLFVVGVTGTNGKTTTSAMIDSIFRIIGDRTGLIGTLGASISGKAVPLDRTTPESPDLQRLFAQMLDQSVRRVVMEVSSEGALAGRTSEVAFDIGVFTNLTQDHLNTHGTMEAYFAQKLRLFTEYADAFPDKPFAGVVNADDPYGVRIIDALEADGRPVLRFSATDPSAPLYAEVHAARANGTRFTLHYRPPVGSVVRVPVDLRIGGLFSVSNALAAAGAAIMSRVPSIAIKNGLEALAGVPGRFEQIDTGGRGFDVIVDYAHSPDGLRNVLESSRALHPSRLICVFGCGGDRDTSKRPKMGAIAESLSDIVIVTSDNPRSESPEAILGDILGGIEDGDRNPKVVVEVDRHEAIRKALCELARPGDLVVIAGKGHESGQQFADRKIPFDDRIVAREVLGQ
ncbi:MAG: UDP-N-acetylmuramoyl-L-alanyl-D-glutamate--2,6-diaminopimelate ligase [Capsulimonadaceae bacterium]